MTYRILLLVTLLVLLFLFSSKVLADEPVVIAQEAPTSPVVKSLYTDEFIRIGGCESTGKPYGKWDYHAKNKYSSASGAFQFVNLTWYIRGRELWGDKFYEKNIWSKDNVELAWYVYQKYGTGDWNSSKPCWN